jgi:hypothetical protein
VRSLDLLSWQWGGIDDLGQESNRSCFRRPISVIAIVQLWNILQRPRCQRPGPEFGTI